MSCNVLSYLHYRWRKPARSCYRSRMRRSFRIIFRIPCDYITAFIIYYLSWCLYIRMTDISSVWFTGHVLCIDRGHILIIIMVYLDWIEMKNDTEWIRTSEWANLQYQIDERYYSQCGVCQYFDVLNLLFCCFERSTQFFSFLAVS